MTKKMSGSIVMFTMKAAAAAAAAAGAVSKVNQTALNSLYNL